MREQPTFFGILPANVRYSKDLTDFQKLLYVEISALTQANGYCYADNSYFAELYGKEVETISRNITKLVKYGFLSREIKYKGNTKEIESRFLRVIPLDKNINTPCQNNQEGTDKNINTPIDKNVKDNNTRDKQYKNNKKIYKKESSLDYSFDDFYQLYPNKKSQDKARVSFEKAIENETFPKTYQELHQCLLPLIVKANFGFPMKYIKHPTTWLNQGCWTDEYSLDEVVDELTQDISDFTVKEYKKQEIINFVDEQMGGVYEKCI